MNIILISIGKQIYGATKDKGPKLEAHGFKQVYDTTQLQTGDVMIFQPVPGHKYGHIQVLGDDGIWYSDFKQPRQLPARAYENGSYKVYRYNQP
jgi:hypothetical protein